MDGRRGPPSLCQHDHESVTHKNSMIVEPVMTRRWTAGPRAGGTDRLCHSRNGHSPLLRSFRNGLTDRTEPTEGSGGVARQRASVRLQRRRARHSVIPTLTRAVSRSRDAGPVGPLINLFSRPSYIGICKRNTSSPRILKRLKELSELSGTMSK